MYINDRITGAGYLIGALLGCLPLFNRGEDLWYVGLERGGLGRGALGTRRESIPGGS
jgi:hypothetical protein